METMVATVVCPHTIKRARKDDPTHGWECAACGEIPGLTRKVVSGGQTGVDRIALEVAKELGIATGGWAPKGWLTEHGPDPALKYFRLVEHESENYPIRTAANVRMADVTVWFGSHDFRGERATARAAEKAGKAYLVNPSVEALTLFLTAGGALDDRRVRVLNIAGDCGSLLTAPDEDHVRSVLIEALSAWNSA